MHFMHMEAASRLQVRVAMDSLSSLRHSPAWSPNLERLRMVVGIGSSAAANCYPRLIKLGSRPRLGSSSVCSASASSTATPSKAAEPRKERDLVFVAGATGRVGSRAVRELIKLGFRVRAAVRDAQRATSLVQVPYFFVTFFFEGFSLLNYALYSKRPVAYFSPTFNLFELICAERPVAGRCGCREA